MKKTSIQGDWLQVPVNESRIKKKELNYFPKQQQQQRKKKKKRKKKII